MYTWTKGASSLVVTIQTSKISLVLLIMSTPPTPINSTLVYLRIPSLESLGYGMILKSCYNDHWNCVKCGAMLQRGALSTVRLMKQKPNYHSQIDGFRSDIFTTTIERSSFNKQQHTNMTRRGIYNKKKKDNKEPMPSVRDNKRSQQRHQLHSEFSFFLHIFRNQLVTSYHSWFPKMACLVEQINTSKSHSKK